MTISKIARTFAALAVAVLLIPAAQAQDKTVQSKADKEKKAVRRMVVVKDGQVYTSDKPGSFAWTEGPNSFFWVGSRGFLGVQAFELTPELREHFRVAKDAGVLVGKVVPDSPAAKAGIRVGDIITSVDGSAVDSSFDIVRAVRNKKSGDSIRIEYSRDGVNGTAIATAVERERKEVDLREFNVQVPDIQIPDVGKNMEQYFNSPEWKAKVEHLRQLPDCGDMQQRMKDLESKLKDLEKRLPK